VTAGEGTQNLLWAHLAIVVFAGPAAKTPFGAWWAGGTVALGIAGWASSRDSGPGSDSPAPAPVSDERPEQGPE
jgi:hypothetical protein